MADTGTLWSSTFAASGPDAAVEYDAIMVPRLFGPWADVLLDELAVTAGEALLDVACGTGALTRRAAVRLSQSGWVTGCDISPAMLAVAQAKPAIAGAAPVEYMECPAETLAAHSGAYDVVTCQHGLQFFSSRPDALSEMHRALRPGGRLGVAVWCAIEDNQPFAALAAGLAEVMGEQTAVSYRGGPWGLADADVATMLVRAGFSVVSVDRRELPATFDGGARQLVGTLVSTGVATKVAALDQAQQDALLAAVETAAAPMLVDGEIRSHTTAQLITATRS